MGVLLRISQSACAALLIAPAALAMGMLGNAVPTGMVLTDASHITNPIIVQSLEINGRAYGAPPYLASTDWENPRGGNRTLTDLAAPTQDGAALVVRADWVEAYTDRAYSAEIVVPDGRLRVEDRTGPTALVTVVFGWNGHLAISTDTGPDAASGEYNGTIVAETCAARRADADVDFSTRLDAHVDLEWVYSQESKRQSMPRIDTPCAGEAG
ncbi:hypothetical protein BCF46_3784 [Litoreibacter meonggei]|uniref:Uncharacterized protein n=1 Tax=Litoreibacter meonggei TaxID=1049199 RepID=A0A497VAP4_9RHOB|nr:hypothetical protein [Litoreibacter meonggei]RLJ36316.1 hypothetical protein BCF46_3784 [Litoreibacter meonggei]